MTCASAAGNDLTKLLIVMNLVQEDLEIFSGEQSCYWHRSGLLPAGLSTAPNGAAVAVIANVTANCNGNGNQCD